MSLREAVIRVADAPTSENRAAFEAALLPAIVFVRLRGMKDRPPPGARYQVPAGSDVHIRHARLPNGMQMILASAASPRSVAPDEVVATMTGLELLEMGMKMPADGVLVAAEDERDSWTAIKREELPALVERAIRTI